MKFYVTTFLLSLFLRASAMQDSFTIQGKTTNSDSHYCTAYLFAHGFGATQNQGLQLFAPRQRWIMTYPIATFNFPDARNDNHEYLREYVNLGQERDIECFRIAFEKTGQALPENDLVLVGISRGATTIINFVAQQQPEQVKALVLESPFDTLSAVIKHLLARHYVSWFPFSEKITHKLCQKIFPDIKPDGIFPLATINKIPKGLPVIFIHATKDKVVPVNSSRRLYIKLKQIGHEDAYLVELASGDHGRIIQGQDNDFYLYAVHAFYKKYGLAHDPDLAQKGSLLLSHCQPSIDEVKKRMLSKRSLDDSIEYDKEEIYELMGYYEDE